MAGVEGVRLFAATLVAEDDGAGGGGGDGPVDGDEDGGVLAEVDEIVAKGVRGVAGGCEGAVGLYYVCSLYVETYLTGPWPDTGGYAEDNNGREARADKQRYMATLKRREE